MIDYTKGASRQEIPRDQAVALIQNHTLIVDERRRRPFYFDGRFLAASALIREQNYFLARQSDLGRATGTGVITGLEVAATGASTLRITPGNGITITGELVTMEAALPVNLADVTENQELDARFGISVIPSPPPRNRSGVYILALRPVEFTANPIASYPKSLTGVRGVEDGDIIEAVAVTLIPYADESSAAEINRQQARIARDVFLRRAPLQGSVNALPLAMLSLSRGVLNWVDPFLVRREVGADHGDTLGLGFAPRALREAQFQQYRRHLQQIFQLRRSGGQPLRFAAADYFYCLPPAGPMPASSVDLDQFTQVYLPIGMQVEISVIPDDELRMLVEDALLLPPIDLSLTAQEQESTSVLMVAPVPRTEFNQIEAGLLNAPPAGAGASVPKLLAGRKPIEALRILQTRTLALPVERRQLTFDERWRVAFQRLQQREAQSGAAQVWFVRRRNLSYRPDIAGAPVRPPTQDLNQQEVMLKLVQAANFQARYDTLRTTPRTTAPGLAVLVDALAQVRYADRLWAFQVAFRVFENNQPLTDAAARRVAAQFDDPAFGAGLQKLATEPFGQTLANQAPVAAYPRLADFDRMLATLDATRVKLVGEKLAGLTANQEQFNQRIDAWLAGGAIQ